MTALVCFHEQFDHAAFLKGDYDRDPDQADGYALLVVDDEDQVFALHNGGNLGVNPHMSATRDTDRSYHVDQSTGEMWTLNPDTGAALSSAAWENGGE